MIEVGRTGSLLLAFVLAFAPACNGLLGIEERPLRVDDKDDGAVASKGCDRPGVVICEDFEGPTFSSAWGTTVDDGATLRRESPGRDSSGALLAEVRDAQGTSAYLSYRGDMTTGVALGTDVRLAGGVDGGLLRLVHFQVASDRFVDITVYFTGGTIKMALGGYTPDGADYPDVDLPAPPFGEWVHLELFFRRTPSELSFAWDARPPVTARLPFDGQSSFQIDIGAIRAEKGTQALTFDNMVLALP